MRLWNAVLAAIGSVVLGIGSPALAQSVGEAPASSATGWIFILLALVLTIAVCVASFMSSKRGHQD